MCVSVYVRAQERYQVGERESRERVSECERFILN